MVAPEVVARSRVHIRESARAIPEGSGRLIQRRGGSRATGT